MYKIPMLFLVGWRGEPGVKDEPQHNLMGRLQEGMCEATGLPYAVLPNDEAELDGCISKALETIKETSGPYALLVKKNAFEDYKLQMKNANTEKTAADPELFSREEALHIMLNFLGSDILSVGTTGVLGRELYEIRERRGDPIGKDFLCVGSMGHASAIAYGLAIGGESSTSGKKKTVVCFDGDGAALMHMGQFAINGSYEGSTPLVHILVNNGLHESVGGQPTVGLDIDFCKIARACGYQFAKKAGSEDEIRNVLGEVKGKIDSANSRNLKQKPYFVEIVVKPGVRKDLGRPKTTPEENKLAFMKFAA